MSTESFSEIAVRIIYAAVSVLIVTAICIYNYLSRAASKKKASRKNVPDSDLISGSEYDVSNERAVAADVFEENVRHESTPERKKSGEGVCEITPGTGVIRKDSSSKRMSPGKLAVRIINENSSRGKPPEKDTSSGNVCYAEVFAEDHLEKIINESSSHAKPVDEDIRESSLNRKPLDEDSRESSSHAKPVGEDIHESSLNRKPVDEDIREILFNRKPVDEDIRESSLHGIPVDEDIRESLLHRKSVDEDIRESSLNGKFSQENGVAVEKNIDESALHGKHVEEDIISKSVSPEKLLIDSLKEALSRRKQRGKEATTESSSRENFLKKDIIIESTLCKKPLSDINQSSIPVKLFASESRNDNLSFSNISKENLDKNSTVEKVFEELESEANLNNLEVQVESPSNEILVKGGISKADLEKTDEKDVFSERLSLGDPLVKNTFTEGPSSVEEIGVKDTSSECGPFEDTFKETTSQECSSNSKPCEVVKVVINESSSEKVPLNDKISTLEDAVGKKHNIESSNDVVPREEASLDEILSLPESSGSRDILNILSPGGASESGVRRYSDIGTTNASPSKDIPSDIFNMKKFNRKSLPAEFLNVLGSGLQAQRARIGGAFSVQNLRDEPGLSRRSSSSTGSEVLEADDENEEKLVRPSEIFQRELKSRANMRLTQKNRNILAARVKDKFTVGDDLFKMIPQPKPLTPIQIKFKETQELLSKQLKQHIKPKAVSPTSEILNDANGSGEGGSGGGLADRLGKLETAAQGWKKRVGPTDAIQFSVAGRMMGSNADSSLLPSVSSPNLEHKKKVPKPTRFKSKAGSNDSSESDENAQSPTVSPSESSLKESVPTINGDINLVQKGVSSSTGGTQDHPKVEVPSTYDDSFSLFFSNVTAVESSSSTDVLNNFDLDELKIDPSLPKLVQRRTTKVQRRREPTRNPVRVLAERKDLRQEYTEIKTGVAENELRRINVEKLSKNSNLAVEALAGLASREDFTAVSLKKPTVQSNAPMLPYKNLMLLLVKGRRHVQTRLVEPTFMSINKGDTYVLVTPNEVFLWLGEFSNVIERSRGGEVAAHIAQTKDLGYIGANNVITIVDGKPSIHAEKFWAHLGVSKIDASKMEAVNAGHLDEDEIYEISLIGTNMVYEVEGDELVPVEKFWGNIPKIEMLDANKILVFDFGTELYVWNGKNASMERRKVASKLAQELWDEGFNYLDCDISPINASLSLGNRNLPAESLNNSGSSRPAFALIGKVTQHMETVLFREKFLDWPDFNRVIRTKSQEEDEKQMVANLDLKACDTNEMLNWKQPEPDFILEGSHLGRGTEYYDDETRRYFAIKTTNVSMWRIEEFESAKLEDLSIGQFYSGDSYIVQWLYTVSVTGRELSGMPSKHNVAGRDRCAYFIWQGRDASPNEQGAAALLTVELDKERGPQVRIIQGHEPPAFWNLFGGSAVVHSGKRSEPIKKNAWRLYMARGEMENEAQLVEVACNIKHLRSRGSFILLHPQKSSFYIWHGSKSPMKLRKCCSCAANNLKSKRPKEFGLIADTEIFFKEFSESEESQDFFDGLGGNNRHLYHSLLNDEDATDFTSMHLFHLSSILGVFQADPVISHSGSFLQQDLYSASQPALFLLDTSKELWLWQGWWPVDGDLLDPDIDSPVEEVRTGGSERGAVAIRWQAERRAAMETALNFWKSKHPTENPKANLVWAGLEPTEFTNLFPEWIDRDDVAELNIRDGRKPCEILSVERELMRLTKSTYPPEVLLQRPLPEGVDPTRLELYLEPKHFKELLGVTKQEFLELPLWKQTKMKKDACLF